ncbi:methionine biosynthesis protein MetW [Hydrogenovibrio sp. JE_KL2]|uniref:methionine biosynthesis protein MetW n=1 Tax=Hydrogenovibrio sp. JE_KL2 TaxID=2651188 RepID=UPI00128C8F1E|nr:methionine biosynthesis protein MetW [Hydrogenovibrio sp. JE_KL2]MPQ77524.1 methionine biosynthesis protein MetW [Hydrogenovibrio sp. JE_KL2]
MSETTLSPEFKLISKWIRDESRVLDLGCGDGQLLSYLKTTRNTTGYGMEIDPKKNIQAIAAGINVIQSNLNSHDIYDYFDEDSFDYVIMTQALQVVRRPDILLDQMLTIGKESIITFPNFGHWRNRAQLLLDGRMPQNDALPDTWYDTANIHLCTFKDFEDLCAEKHIQVVDRAVVNRYHESSILMKLIPNLLGEVAIYRVKRK